MHARMRYVAGIMLLLGLASTALALPPDEAQKLYERVRPSLVVVKYTVEGEFGRRELIGQGVVIGREGLVMASLGMFPRQIPDVQMKEFKIALADDEETEFDASFLGRDDRSDTAFLKTTQQQSWPAIEFVEAPVDVRDPVISIGLLPKEAGYRAYYVEAYVSAVLRGPTPYVLVSPEGLASVGSPVFNTDGKAIGLVPSQQGQTVLLNANPNGNPIQAIALPPRLFTPARDFEISLKDPPHGEPLKLPWLGAQLTGMSKEVAQYYNLKGQAVALVGEVIPDTPAAKAGLKAGDKIIQLNGKPLERGDEPVEVAQILNRKVRRMKLGEKITLSVLRERGKPPRQIELTLEEQPRQPNLAERFYAEDLGLSVREIVFEDTYYKRLPPDTRAVVVAYVRQASSAASAALKNGDVITELNSVPVQSLDAFRKQYQEFRKEHPHEVVVLVVVREGSTQVIKMEPPQ